MPMEVRTMSKSFVLHLVNTVAESRHVPAEEEFALVSTLVHMAASKISNTIKSFLQPKQIGMAKLNQGIFQFFEDYILLRLGWDTLMPPFSRGYIRQVTLADYLFHTVCNADDSIDLHAPLPSTELLVSASELHVSEANHLG